MGVDAGCLAKDADQPKSHDNLFHTVLGMMDVETRIYDRDLDAFAACTRPLDKENRPVPGYHAAQNGEPASSAGGSQEARWAPGLL
jgi:lipid A ethanolaminephosphotransferase